MGGRGRFGNLTGSSVERPRSRSARPARVVQRRLALLDPVVAGCTIQGRCSDSLADRVNHLVDLGLSRIAFPQVEQRHLLGLARFGEGAHRNTNQTHGPRLATSHFLQQLHRTAKHLRRGVGRLRKCPRAGERSKIFATILDPHGPRLTSVPAQPAGNLLAQMADHGSQHRGIRNIFAKGAFVADLFGLVIWHHPSRIDPIGEPPQVLAPNAKLVAQDRWIEGSDITDASEIQTGKLFARRGPRPTTVRPATDPET